MHHPSPYHPMTLFSPLICLLSEIYRIELIIVCLCLQYSCIDTSIISKYVMQPFWNWCVEV